MTPKWVQKLDKVRMALPDRLACHEYWYCREVELEFEAYVRQLRALLLSEGFPVGYGWGNGHPLLMKKIGVRLGTSRCSADIEVALRSIKSTDKFYVYLSSNLYYSEDVITEHHSVQALLDSLHNLDARYRHWVSGYYAYVPCHGCHYSDTGGSYCGLGMDMVPDCLHHIGISNL
jgi:hypothetical protein